jgi:DNA-binding winged helix-turn-helix (wHTH) protein
MLRRGEGMQEPPCLVFGPSRLDLRDERLWRGPEGIHSHPKTLAVLRALVARAGQLLTKIALFAAVWPETVMREAVLTVAIRELRRALGDQARRPQFIETVYGRGYRFLSPITGAPSSASLRSPEPVGQPQPAAREREGLFVGREADLAQLEQWWGQARRGTRQIAFITGAAGIGKTALVDAFVAHMSATQTLWVGHGQCIEPYSQGEP